MFHGDFVDFVVDLNNLAIRMYQSLNYPSLIRNRCECPCAPLSVWVCVASNLCHQDNSCPRALCFETNTFLSSLWFLDRNKPVLKLGINREYLPQPASMHRYLLCEWPQYILMMHPNRHPSWLGRRKFQNRILWYWNICGCHGNWGYAECDMIYHTACQSHRRSANQEQSEFISHIFIFNFPGQKKIRSELSYVPLMHQANRLNLGIRAVYRWYWPMFVESLRWRECHYCLIDEQHQHRYWRDALRSMNTLIEAFYMHSPIPILPNDQNMLMSTLNVFRPLNSTGISC